MLQQVLVLMHYPWLWDALKRNVFSLDGKDGKGLLLLPLLLFSLPSSLPSSPCSLSLLSLPLLSLFSLSLSLSSRSPSLSLSLLSLSLLSLSVSLSSPILSSCCCPLLPLS